MINKVFFHDTYGWGTVVDLEIPITQYSIVLIKWHNQYNTYDEPPSSLPWNIISEYLEKEN